MPDKRWIALLKESSDIKLERMRGREQMKMQLREDLKEYDKVTKTLESSARLAVNRYVSEAFKAGVSMETITGAGKEEE